MPNKNNKKYPNDNLFFRERSEKRILPVSHIIVPYWKLNFIKNKKGDDTNAAYELSEKEMLLSAGLE